ncbi:tetratricopeptide repeat protein [Segatella copri]|uniref:tetratricopeptide repeat protein n=1 Tax=Segatella copri TaxID=165179 RepID=UPI003F71E3D8
MMKRKVNIWKAFALMFLVLMSPVAASAQKKEIQTAKDQVKAGKNLDQAAASMKKLLADSANRTNRKIWTIYFDAVRKQYEQGNEKLYLKQKYDTAQLFNYTRQLFEVAFQYDSVETAPDKKGRRDFEFRKGHSEYLAHIRSNLYNGGIWFLNKKKYPDAYKFFDCYIECASQPMFKQRNYGEKDKHLPTAAYYAVYSGYKMKDPKATLHHSYEALKDTVHYNYMLQYLAETYMLEKDTARYVASLKEGFKRVPTFPYFFPRLVEYYVVRNQLDSAMTVVNEALIVVPDSDVYLAAKSNLLLEQGKLQECIEVSKKVIEVNQKLGDPYYNAGICYFNLAVEQDKNSHNSRKVKEQVEANYKKALPYLVKYREMEPKEQGKWAFPLYTIYLNLNMGKEFDEIDKVMKQK